MADSAKEYKGFQMGPFTNVDEANKEYQRLLKSFISISRQNVWMARKIFGKMSERYLGYETEPEPTLFDEVLPEVDQEAVDAAVAEMEATTSEEQAPKKAGRRVRKPIADPNLRVEVVDVYPDGVDLSEYTEIDVVETDTLAIRPAEIYIKRIRRHRMVLKSSVQAKDPDRKAFAIAPLPKMAVYKGMASESLLADIFVKKYQYHIPFYRQIRMYSELGLDLAESTMCDWFAVACSFIETCRSFGVNVRAWLEDVLLRIDSTEEKDLDDLLPWNWVDSRKRTNKTDHPEAQIA